MLNEQSILKNNAKISYLEINKVIFFSHYRKITLAYNKNIYGLNIVYSVDTYYENLDQLNKVIYFLEKKIPSIEKKIYIQTEVVALKQINDTEELKKILSKQLS